MKKLFLSCIAFILLVFSACTNLDVKKPTGFAELESKKQYKAVSPEGMLYRVRILDNYPEQEIDFWAEALKNHLEKEGYVLTVDGRKFQAREYPGIFFEWAVPYGHEGYIYMTAIVVSEKKIAVAEAAGEHTVYSRHREALNESLESITLK